MASVISLQYDDIDECQPVTLPGSKSIAARALILKYVYSNKEGREIDLTGLPDCDDTRELTAALNALRLARDGQEFVSYDLGLGGTTLRFFLALAASLPGFRGQLNCSEGLRRRPIKPLVEALRLAGGEISGDSFPMRVIGRKLSGEGVWVEGGQTSQFLSALMMASLLWDKPFRCLQGARVSVPYIEMTSKLIDKLACSSDFYIEGDWSAAGFFYEFALLNPGKEICLKGLVPPDMSVQGDSECQRLFEKVGVNSWWEPSTNGAQLLHIKGHKARIKALSECGEKICFEMAGMPDLVPPLAVGMCMARIRFEISGIGHLRHKESDRIKSLVVELGKVGYKLESDVDTMSWDGTYEYELPNRLTTFSSHGDHRIAMSFAMTAARYGQIELEEPETVTKSFPGFYSSIADIGIEVVDASPALPDKE